MKKSLFAFAALTLLAATVGHAQAQSNVTLYGTVDASLQYISNANAAGQDLNVGYADSAISSSVWGLRGNEDLGGGMKASFHAESDLQSNNGGLNHNGLFRRAANVGLGGNYGQLDLGLKANPLMVAHNALMPVAGNSVAASAAYAVDYKDDYTKNAITYTSPNLAGLIAQAQVGLGNTVGENGGGNVYAGSLTFAGVQNLTLRAAIQRRIQGKSISAANAKSASSTAGDPNMFYTAIDGDKTSYLAGVSYKWNKLTLAGAWLHNTKSTTAAAHVTTTINATQFGLGYQATPSILVGASYAISTLDSSLINLQARYSLSKRSTLYAQIGLANNGRGGQFSPVFTNTGLQPAADISTWNSKGLTNTNQSAFGLGMIHTF
jgi:predicted porin